MKVWLDGRWGSTGSWPLDDRGLLFGDQVFETLRVDSGVVRFADLHRARVSTALDTMGLSSALRDFDRIVREVPARPARASLRVTITAGAGRVLSVRAGRPRVFALLRPRLEAPQSLRVTVTSGRRGSLIPSHLKHASYLGEVLARRAATPDFDDVIVRNVAGRPCELAAANLFAVRHGALLTPPLSEGVLPGITRALVIALARKHHIEVRQQAFSMRTLASADELFATSTLLGVCAIVRVGTRALAHGQVTRTLHDAYQALPVRQP